MNLTGPLAEAGCPVIQDPCRQGPILALFLQYNKRGIDYVRHCEIYVI